MSQHPITPRTRRRTLPLLIAAAAAGIALAIVLGVLLRPEPAASVSEVEREVRRIVLHRSERPGVEHGGPIGPWWIAAESVNEVTGVFRNFHFRAGSIRMAAKSAELRVSPENNTISFLLRDVVYTKLPTGRSDDDNFDHSLLAMDSYVLGPAPYRRKIVRDGASTIQPSILERIVGADSSR